MGTKINLFLQMKILRAKEVEFMRKYICYKNKISMYSLRNEKFFQKHKILEPLMWNIHEKLKLNKKDKTQTWRKRKSAPNK